LLFVRGRAVSGVLWCLWFWGGKKVCAYFVVVV